MATRDSPGQGPDIKVTDDCEMADLPAGAQRVDLENTTPKRSNRRPSTHNWKDKLADEIHRMRNDMIAQLHQNTDEKEQLEHINAYLEEHEAKKTAEYLLREQSEDVDQGIKQGGPDEGRDTSDNGYRNPEQLESKPSPVRIQRDDKSQQVIKSRAINLRSISTSSATSMNIPYKSQCDQSNPKDESTADAAVLVVGIKGISTEILEMYFESKKKSGGGEIDKLLREDSDNSDSAIIYFKDPEIAARILDRKKPYQLEGKEMHVEELPKPQKNDPFSIVVQNISATTSKEALELYFESKKKSGGGDVENIEYEEGSNVAVVTFEDVEVTQRVLSLEREHNLGDRVLNVLPRLIETCETPVVTLPVDPRVIIVEGVNSSTTKETLTMFFESKKKSGGGDVSEIKTENGYIKVIFEDEDDAERVLEKNDLQLEGSPLKTRRPEPSLSTPPSKRTAYVTTPLFASASDVDTFHTIMIFNLKYMKRKELKKILEDRHSGGGEIQKLDFILEQNIAIVRFKNKTDAETLFKKGTIKFREQCLPVIPVDTSVEENELYQGPLAISASNIKSTTHRDMIESFFKNKKKSGGGGVNNIFWNPEEEVAVITFIHADTVRSVYEKHSIEPLVFNKCELEIKKMTPPLPPKLVLGPKEDKKAFIIEAPCVSTDELSDYIKSVDSQQMFEINDVCFSFKGRTILLEFKEEPDFRTLGLHFATRPLKNHMLTLQRVPLATQVQVHDVHIDDELGEMLELHFQDPSHGGDENVELARLDSEQNYAILDCGSASVVNAILQRKHPIAGRKVHVSSYHPEFGIVPLNFDATKPWHSVPPPYIHQLHMDEHQTTYIFEFIKSSKGTHDRITETGNSLKLFIVDWAKTSEKGIVVNCHPEYIAAQKEKTWSNLCKQELDKILSKVAVEKVSTLVEFLKLMTDEAEKQNESQKVIVQIEEEQSVITITGWEADVKHIANILWTKIKELEEQMMRAKSSVEESVRVKDHHKTIAEAKRYPDKISQKFPNMDLTFPHSDEMVLRGLPSEVRDAKLIFYEEIVNSIHTEKIQMESERCMLMMNSEVQEYASSLFRQHNLCVHMDVSECDVTVYTLTKDDLKSAIAIVKNLTKSSLLELRPENSQVLRTTAWETMTTRLMSQYPGLLHLDVQSRNDQIIVVCVADKLHRVLEAVGGCLDENSILDQMVKLSAGCLRLFEQSHKAQINAIMEQFHRYSVSCQAFQEQTFSGYLIRGTKNGLPPVVQKIKELAVGVIDFDYTIERHGMHQYFGSPKGKEFLEALEIKHSITCEIVNPALETEARQLRATDEYDLDEEDADEALQEIYKATFEEGFTITLMLGDITKLAVDAIVNAANANLGHYGGIALDIVKAGGDTIQRECSDYIKRRGQLLPGQVFLGRQSGQLPCRFVIHAVGPVYATGQHNQTKADELYQAVYASLEAANRENLMSVALPALSTGIFRYPVGEASELICEATVDYFMDNQTSIKEVILVDILPATVNTFKLSLLELIRKKEIKPNLTQDTAELRQRIEKDLDPATTPHAPAAASGGVTLSPVHWLKGSKSDKLGTTCGISVELKKANIVKEQADVIVNTSNTGLDLKKGAISFAILQIAGNIIQDECSEFAPDGVQYAEVVRTSPGKLKGVKAIYHGACDVWSQEKGQSTEILKRFVRNCLEAADQDGYTSIAFPAVGTGNLKFPRQLVCQCLFDEFLAFSQKYPESSIRDIRVILYEKDTETVKVFREHVKQLSGALEPSVRPKSHTFKGITKKHRESTHKKKSLSPELSHAELDYCERESTDLVLKLGTVTLSAKIGDITDEDTEAIVNSTNAMLTFKRGSVSTAILKKGGQEIEKDCQEILNLTRTGRIEGHALTPGRNLRCKQIVHMDAQTTQWEHTVRRTLQFADEHKIRSLAFPALGTGEQRNPPAEMAHIMLKALTKFDSEDNPKYLTRVHIILMDPEVFKAFKREVDRIMRGQEPVIMNLLKAAYGGISRAFGYGAKTEGANTDDVQVEAGSITLRLYAMSQDRIDVVVKRLEQLCDEETSTLTLDKREEQDIIKHLKPEQVEEIKILGGRYNTRVDVEQGNRLNRISLAGAIKDVGECYKATNEILQSAKRAREEAEQADDIAKLVQWEFLTDGVFAPYTKDINLIIHKAYTSDGTSVLWRDANATKFVVFFDRMVQEQGDGQGDSVTVRRRLLQVPDATGSLPSNWQPMGKEDYFKLTELLTTDAEYQAVEAGFKKTCSNNIVKIERLQNPSLYQQYKVKKEHMDKTNPAGHTNERTLYHGTAEPTLKNINTMGFNRSYCGKNATVYGSGVYFARDASYSARNNYSPPDANGRRYMYESKVLTGEFTTCPGSADRKTLVAPPPKNPQIPNVLFDSVVDSSSVDPTIFVIFHDTQAYPAYLITFT